MGCCQSCYKKSWVPNVVKIPAGQTVYCDSIQIGQDDIENPDYDVTCGWIGYGSLCSTCKGNHTTTQITPCTHRKIIITLVLRSWNSSISKLSYIDSLKLKCEVLYDKIVNIQMLLKPESV